MTRADSDYNENNGLCESCNRPETLDQAQHAWPVYLAGGLGWGTMFLCPECYAGAKDTPGSRARPPSAKQIEQAHLRCRSHGMAATPLEEI